MRKLFAASMSLAIVLAAANLASAQKFGGGGGNPGGGGGNPGGGGGNPGGGGFGGGNGGGFGERGEIRINWIESVDRIIQIAASKPADNGAKKPELPIDPRTGRDISEKKYIFAYIRPLNEDKEPQAFSNADLARASRDFWGFVRMDFDRENAHQKAWGVKSAPSVVGCDTHGNVFQMAAGNGLDAMRSIINSVPPQVSQFQARLKSSFERAAQAGADEAKAVKAYVDILMMGKFGYPEVKESATKLAELGETALKKGEVAESVSVESGISYYDGLTKSYKTSGPGVLAEVRIARLENGRGNYQLAIQRLLKLLKVDARLLKTELEAVEKLIADISSEGEKKIEAALAGDKVTAKESVKKLAKDYAGTEAGKRAVEESKKL